MTDDSMAGRRAAAAPRAAIEPREPDPHHGGEPLARLLALTTAVQVLTTFVVAALPTLAPRVAATVGLQPAAVGFQVSIVYVLAALMSAYSGQVVRRYGACAASMISLVCAAVALLLMATGSIAGIVLGSIVLGAGYGLPGPAASHLFVRFAPRGNRNLIFSIKQAGMPLGVAVASLLLPPLSEAVGWQAALLVGVAVVGLLLVALLPRRRRWDDDRGPTATGGGHALAGLAIVAGHPTLRSIGAIGLCYGGFQMCVIAFTVTMLVGEHGWSLVAAGGVAGAMQLAGVAGRIGYSLIADATRSGLVLLAWLGLLTAACALAASLLGGQASSPLLVALLLALASSMLGWNGIMLAETARISGPERVGLATGGILSLCFLSVVVMPPAFAMASRGVGSLTATLGLFAIFPCIGAVAALQAWRRDRRASGTG